MEVTPETTFLLGLLLFWIVLYAISQLLHAEKHGFKIFPFFLTYRSEKFKGMIGRISRKNTLLWKTLSNVGMALALGLMIYSTYFLFSNLLKFFLPAVESVPVVPVIPGVTISLDSLPYFFVAVAIIVLLHEFAHGISAVAEKVEVKSAGLAVMLAFFGGFVEPEEKSFEKTSKTSKLRILGAGSAVNLVTGLLVIILLASLFAPSAGVLVNSTLANGPAARAGVQRFDVIQAVDNKTINSLQDLSAYLANVTPGSNLSIEVNNHLVTVTTENLSGRAIIGIYGLDYYPSRLGLNRIATANTYLTLYWTFIAAFSVAVFNMLPAFPFDGEKFLYYSLADYVGEKNQLRLRVLINAVFLGLLVSNVVLSLWFFGLPSV
ncbi:MAG TPA: site-2 protease family protein [Candidatus Bathyarchaeia archaeon]|nr:site-2 protease family protein [Candidatus Bathyarchaeia archaeon]